MENQLSSGIIAAIFGALAGGFFTVIFEFLKWLFNRRALKKTILTGLYFEIDHHKIIKLPVDSDGQPNFVLTSFQDSFYNNNLANITKLLSENIIQHLTFYYSSLKSVIDHQKELLELNSQINDIKLKNIKNVPETHRQDELIKQREELKHILRTYLAPCLNSREILFDYLTTAFSEEPARRAYINVLPEHKEWWNQMTGKESN